MGTGTTQTIEQWISATCPECGSYDDHDYDGEVTCIECGDVFEVEPEVEEVEQASGCSRFNQEYCRDFDRQLSAALCGGVL